MKVSTLVELLRDYQDYVLKIDPAFSEDNENEEKRLTTPFKITVDDKIKVVYIKCQLI